MKKYKITRSKIASCDPKELARVNANIIAGLMDRDGALLKPTDDDKAAADLLRQQLKLQLAIGREIRDMYEVDEIRDLVAELRDHRNYIEKHGASGQDMGTPETTH